MGLSSNVVIVVLVFCVSWLKLAGICIVVMRSRCKTVGNTIGCPYMHLYVVLWGRRRQEQEYHPIYMYTMLMSLRIGSNHTHIKTG